MKINRCSTLLCAFRIRFKTEREELDEEEWKQIIAKVKEALLHLDEFRVQEGDALYKDIESNIQRIQDLLPEVEPFEKERLDKVKERIMDNMKELEASDSVDNNRLEQEMIYYLEKLDINEEKVRLANHCTYFLETMRLNEQVGKKAGIYCTGNRARNQYHGLQSQPRRNSENCHSDERRTRKSERTNTECIITSGRAIICRNEERQTDYILGTVRFG